jgi:peptide/nickel transport system permease protein
MGRYVVRRLLVALPTVLALSFLIFTLVHNAPGDPAEELAHRRSGGSKEVTDEEIRQVRHEIGLDRPFLVQYADWLKGAVHGDLGRSFLRQTSVGHEIVQRFPASAELAGVALAMILLLSIPLGVAAAMFHRHWLDDVLRVLSLIGASVPSFFLGYLLIILFATRLGILPVAGRQQLDSVLLPALTVSVLPAAVVSRLLRSSLLEVFSEDYMRTARSKGLGALAAVVRHGLRNAAVPVVTYLGTVLGQLLEGVVITEVIFAWPGIGQLTVQSITGRDYPMVQGIVLFAGVVFIASNLLVDVSYGFLDPRIRMEGSREHV